MTLLAQTGHVLHLYWVQERSQFHFALFNSFVMPGTVAYLGWMLMPGDPAAQRWWMAGSLTLGLGMGGLAQVGFAVLNDRFLGRLDLLRSAPIPKAAYLGAQVALAVLEAIALVGVGLVALTALGLAAPDALGVAGAVLAAACAGGAIGSLGAVLALRAPDFDAGNTVVGIAALGLALASPVFYAIDSLPAVLRPLAWLSPFTHVAPLLRSVLAGGGLPLGPLLATLALAAGYLALGYRLARWQE